MQARGGGAITWQKAGEELGTIFGFCFQSLEIIEAIKLGPQKEEKGKSPSPCVGVGVPRVEAAKSEKENTSLSVGWNPDP